MNKIILENGSDIELEDNSGVLLLEKQTEHQNVNYSGFMSPFLNNFYIPIIYNL